MNDNGDVPLSHALLLWNSGLDGGTPAFAVRPLGHDHYYDYDYQAGACLRRWYEAPPALQREMLFVQIWHITAFYGVPASAMTAELLRIPEYRALLADDCLPPKYRNERR